MDRDDCPVTVPQTEQGLTEGLCQLLGMTCLAQALHLDSDGTVTGVPEDDVEPIVRTEHLDVGSGLFLEEPLPRGDRSIGVDRV